VWKLTCTISWKQSPINVRGSTGVLNTGLKLIFKMGSTGNTYGPEGSLMRKNKATYNWKNKSKEYNY
jgi:hypothetical protein